MNYTIQKERPALRRKFKKADRGLDKNDVAGDEYLHNLYIAAYWPMGKAVEYSYDFISTYNKASEANRQREARGTLRDNLRRHLDRKRRENESMKTVQSKKAFGGLADN